jgi:hypothetical protein
MGLYQRPDSTVFWMAYTDRGRRIRESTGTSDATEAKRILQDRQGRIARGEVVLSRLDKIGYDEVRADLVTYYQTHGTRDVTEAEGASFTSTQH